MDQATLGPQQRGSFALIVLAAFVVVCAGVKAAEPVLSPIVLGGFIATVNVPQVFWLYRRHAPLWLAIALALLADIVAFLAFSSLLAVAAADLSTRLPLYVARLQEAEQQASGFLHALGVHGRLHETLDPGAVVGFIASLASDVATVVTELGLALTIAAFLLFRFAKASTSSSPSILSRTEGVRRAVREMYRYIAVKTVTSIVTGVAVGLWLWIIDADLPILFGLLAFLLNYIPTLGSIVASSLAIGVALLQHGPEHAALVAAGSIFVNVGIGNIIEPRYMGRALGLWPLVVLISVVFWGWLLGIVGAVLSSLLTQVVKLLLLATPDLRIVGLALGPKLPGASTRLSQADLLEEAMPPSARPKPPA